MTFTLARPLSASPEGDVKGAQPAICSDHLIADSTDDNGVTEPGRRIADSNPDAGGNGGGGSGSRGFEEGGGGSGSRGFEEGGGRGDF